MHRQTVVLNELDEDGETVVVTSSVACPMLAATHTQLTRTECRDALYTLQSINQSIRTTTTLCSTLRLHYAS